MHSVRVDVRKQVISLTANMVGHKVGSLRFGLGGKGAVCSAAFHGAQLFVGFSQFSAGIGNCLAIVLIRVA